MKILRNIVMTFAIMAAFSAVAFAQKDDKKPPPKDPPPVINPGSKNPPPQKPENKPKKPNSEGVAFWIRETFETA